MFNDVLYLCVVILQILNFKMSCIGRYDCISKINYHQSSSFLLNATIFDLDSGSNERAEGDDPQALN